MSDESAQCSSKLWDKFLMPFKFHLILYMPLISSLTRGFKAHMSLGQQWHIGDEVNFTEEYKESPLNYANSIFHGICPVLPQGVKFIFNKIDLQSPDKEYSVTLKLAKDRYNCELKFLMKLGQVS